MDLELENKRVLVGGASRGIGAAVAAAMATEGARVALVARPSDDLKRRAAELGGTAIGADLSTLEGPSDAVRLAVDALGGIDVLVVNSGGPPPGNFDELDEAKWHAAVEGTLMYPIRVIKAALPHLGAGNGPAILVILSSSVREAIPGLDSSNTLRPGLAGLLKSLAGQLAPVRINGIAPGRVQTDRITTLDHERAKRAGLSVEEVRRQACARIPLGRYGNPAEVGRLAAVLCSSAASYVSGVILAVDGGMARSLP
jgi:3-oxoacyl-[acyl-carrier protein] reductase